MEKERRKFVRFRVPFCAKFKLDEEGKELSAVTRDLSYGGTRLIIDTSQKLPENPQVYLEIVFPEQTLKFSAKIIWSKPYAEEKQEAGFSFIKLPETYKELIYKYILKYAPQEMTSRWWQE
ncbi:MAG: PilZ domain-containing protein [Candidatus Omnitrophica bacterium]|nr:PilZ domain-containing protein [Candidatus Omnitrophota bacterium]